MFGQDQGGGGEVALHHRLVPDDEVDRAAGAEFVGDAVEADGAEAHIGARALDREEGGQGGVCAQGEYGSDVALDEPPGDDSGASLRIVDGGRVDRELLDRAAVVGGVESVAALGEGHVVGFVDDAEDVALDAGGGEGFAGLAPDGGFIDGDVQGGTEFGGGGGAGVEGDDVDSGGAGFGHCVADSVGVGQGGGNSDGSVFDAAADQRAVLFGIGVETGFDAAVDIADAGVQRSDRGALVEEAPEEAGRAVGEEAVVGLAVGHQLRQERTTNSEREVGSEVEVGRHLVGDRSAGEVGRCDADQGVCAAHGGAQVALECVGVNAGDRRDRAVPGGIQVIAVAVEAFGARIEIGADHRSVAHGAEVVGCELCVEAQTQLPAVTL